jgi:hypothetical protein
LVEVIGDGGELVALSYQLSAIGYQLSAVRHRVAETAGTVVRVLL